MNNPVEQEFRHLSTDELMRAYAGAIKASTQATKEMMQQAESAGFRAARVRADFCRQTCDDLREALFLRIISRESNCMMDK